MRSRDYEYGKVEEYQGIPQERKEELLKKVKDQIRKGFIAHHQILQIGEGDEELDFLYDWLSENDVTIRGINGTISGEIPNYKHIPKMGQSFVPERLDDSEQEELFIKLNSFSDEDKKNHTQEYERIRNTLIEKNMKLANWITSWHSISAIPLPLEDKKQMAYIGLISAVDKYNPSLGYKFSTFAWRVIYRRIITESYRSGGNVGRTMRASEQLKIMNDLKEKLIIEYGEYRHDFKKDIAYIMGIKERRIDELERFERLEQEESIEQIEDKKRDKEALLDTLTNVDKIEQTGSGNIQDGVYIDEEDVLPAGFTKKDRTADKALVECLKADVRKAVSKLSNKEQVVLFKRFGFYNGEMETLEQIGMYYGVSKERISQIESKAIRKLRHPSRSKALRQYVGEDLEQNDDVIELI